MGIQAAKSLIHWNYFLALESDLEQVSRYIEFDRGNFKTYSIELAHLLLASSSEVDVIAKGLCDFLEPNSSAENINQYQGIICRNIPEFVNEPVYVSRFNLKLKPWSNWKTGNNPLWWRSYNKVKHERSDYFPEANLKNVLNSISGLLITVFYFYKLQFASESRSIENIRDVNEILKPAARFLSLQDDYYYGRLLLE